MRCCDNILTNLLTDNSQKIVRDKINKLGKRSTGTTSQKSAGDVSVKAD